MLGAFPTRRASMTESRESRTQQVDLANLGAAIERAAVDLALAEEPSRFIVALEEGAEESV